MIFPSLLFAARFSALPEWVLVLLSKQKLSTRACLLARLELWARDVERGPEDAD